MTGLDDHGTTVGEVVIRLGDVYLLEEERHGLGRELTVTVLGETAQHISEGFDHRTLPLLDLLALDRFLLDPRVSAPLARWGITFDPAPPLAQPAGPLTTETSFATCAFGGSDYSSCCQWGSGSTTFEYRCSTNPVLLAKRHCPGIGGTSSCNAVGPRGCAVCWTLPYSFSCSTFGVFFNSACAVASDNFSTCGVTCPQGQQCDPDSARCVSQLP